MKNIYIIRGVLIEDSAGMVIIIASDLKECRELFMGRFPREEFMKDFDNSIKYEKYEAIPVSEEQESRIVIYMYGSV